MLNLTRSRLVAKGAKSSFLWSGVTEKAQPKGARHFFAPFFAKKAQEFLPLRLSIVRTYVRTTPKMNDEYVGSSVDAVVAALKSPLQNKLLGYFLSNGWARHNYSISFK